MLYPTGIVLNNNYSIILYLTGDILNVGSSKNFGGAYVAQIGTLVTSCDLDDFVQYDLSAQVPFQQSGVTFAHIQDKDVLFVQDPLP